MQDGRAMTNQELLLRRLDHAEKLCRMEEDILIALRLEIGLAERRLAECQRWITDLKQQAHPPKEADL